MRAVTDFIAALVEKNRAAIEGERLGSDAVTGDPRGDLERAEHEGEQI